MPRQGRWQWQGRDRERYYSADDDLDAWMQKHEVSEADVLAWVRGPSLWTYVVKRLKQLAGKAA